VNHFVYKHLPAGGLSTRDPRRPFATGGLGNAVVFVFPPTSLRMRVATLENVGVIGSEVEGKPR
jgi:hypothetical protein